METTLATDSRRARSWSTPPDSSKTQTCYLWLGQWGKMHIYWWPVRLCDPALGAPCPVYTVGGISYTGEVMWPRFGGPLSSLHCRGNLVHWWGYVTPLWGPLSSLQCGWNLVHWWDYVSPPCGVMEASRPVRLSQLPHITSLSLLYDETGYAWLQLYTLGIKKTTWVTYNHV